MLNEVRRHISNPRPFLHNIGHCPQFGTQGLVNSVIDAPVPPCGIAPVIESFYSKGEGKSSLVLFVVG